MRPVILRCLCKRSLRTRAQPCRPALRWGRITPTRSILRPLFLTGYRRPRMCAWKCSTCLGQRLATLVDAERSAGAHTAQWDGTDEVGRAVGAGVYIYRLSGGGDDGESADGVGGWAGGDSERRGQRLQGRCGRRSSGSGADADSSRITRFMG